MRAALAGSSLTAEQEEFAARGIKAMMPIGRPFLDYSLTALADAGCGEICLIIGPEHDLIRNYYQALKPKRVHISFAVQREPLGTANALRAAREFTGSDSFLVINSDNYYPANALRKLRELGGSGVIGFERSGLLESGAIDEQRLRAYATLRTDADCHLRIIEEKPSRVEADALISMNSWSFTPTIYRACDTIGPSLRGEYEIPSAVQYAIETLREQFQVIPFRGEVLDLSSRGDVATVARHLERRSVQL